MGKVYDHEGEEIGLFQKLNPISEYNSAKRNSKSAAKKKRESEIGQGTFKKTVSGLLGASGIFARYGAGILLLMSAFALAKDGFKQFLTPAFHLFTNVVGGWVDTAKEKLPGAKTAAALGHRAVQLGGKAVDTVQPLTDAAGRVKDAAIDTSVNLYEQANDFDRRAGNTIRPKSQSGDKALEYFQARAVRPETGECRAQLIQELNKQRGITPQQQGATRGSTTPQTSSTPPAIPTIPGCDY